MILHRLKPDVPKCWLFTASGVMWSGVGAMMCTTGFGWLAQEGMKRTLGVAAAGFALAVMATVWCFGGIARRNIERLRRLPARGCLFAFQAWKSYLVILFMVTLGITLRRLPIPSVALSIIYIGIGGALLLSSFLYYRYLGRLLKTTRQRSARHRQC
jgi:hypothetical protein